MGTPLYPNMKDKVIWYLCLRISRRAVLGLRMLNYSKADIELFWDI